MVVRCRDHGHRLRDEPRLVLATRLEAALDLDPRVTGRDPARPAGDECSGGERVSRWLPLGGNVRPLGSLKFGDLARISPRWFSDDQVAFTATVPKEFEHQRWRAATFDTFMLGGWARTSSKVTPYFVNAGVRFVEEMCKLSALGELWEKLGRERYGVTDESMLRLR